MATRIERREEGKIFVPDYTRELTEAEIADGRHRQWVGGHYDTEYGRSQVDFLQSRGLQPHHKFIDVGCGSFRGGRFTIDYLDASNYFGVDANQSVMQAGYDTELDDAQRAKVPVTNLRANERFDTDFGVAFGFGLAQSVFSHVSLNHIRLCLFRLAKVTSPGAKFYATYFEQPASTDLDFIRTSPRAKQRFSERNVYWYYRSDLKWAASRLPWTPRYVGKWGQLAGQVMMEYERTPDPSQVVPPASGSRAKQIIHRGRR